MSVIQGIHGRSRREELAAMSGKDVFSELFPTSKTYGVEFMCCTDNFYSRLKDIRDYHRKFPDQSGDLLLNFYVHLKAMMNNS